MRFNVTLTGDGKAKTVNKTANHKLWIDITVDRLPVGRMWLEMEKNARGNDCWTLNWQKDEEDTDYDEIAYGECMPRKATDGEWDK